MSPLLFFGKQLLITASHPGTKTHFRSTEGASHPTAATAQHPPITTFQQGKGVPENGLTTPSLWVSSPACRMFTHPPLPSQHLTANTDPALTTALLRQPLRLPAQIPQVHSPCHLKNSL